MKLIMARRLDPWTGYDAYRNDQPRTIQLEIRDGNLHTRWGPVISQRIEGQEVHMRERSSSNQREEDFTIPLAELERLQQALDWQRLILERPTAYWRKLSREGYATLAMRPDPQGKLRGDYILLTIYQCIHWFDDGSCFTTSEEFFSGEGNEGAVDQASIWSQQVEKGEMHPIASLHYVDVPLAVGKTVKIIDGGINNRPLSVKDQPRNLNGKEAVIVEAGRVGALHYQDQYTGEWKLADGDWYVECEGERLKFSLKGHKEISASHYVFSELNARLDTEGQVVSEQQYHVADLHELRKRLQDLEKQAGHNTIRFPSAADLVAWLPSYRIIKNPDQQKEG